MKPNDLSKPSFDINVLLANAPETVIKDINEPSFDWDNALHSDNYDELKSKLNNSKVKIPTNIRLSKDVTDYFKATGKGWQTRINQVLLDYVHANS